MLQTKQRARVFRKYCSANILLQSFARFARRVVRKLSFEQEQTLQSLGRPRQLIEASSKTEMSFHVVDVQMQRRVTVSECGVHIAVPTKQHTQLRYMTECKLYALPLPLERTACCPALRPKSVSAQ